VQYDPFSWQDSRKWLLLVVVNPIYANENQKNFITPANDASVTPRYNLLTFF
jgi:hypothetical protein